MIKLYNCFHDLGSLPEKNIISDIRPALLCGADVSFRNHKEYNYGVHYEDNTGDNISSENLEYSELTGYYWVWKNESADIVGIEHYRRHFVNRQSIGDELSETDLLTGEEITNILTENDFVITKHDYILGTDVFGLYSSCFGKENLRNIASSMKRYFIESNKEYYLDAFYSVLSENRILRGNMLIAPKKEFDKYCEVMFDMVDYLKQNITTFNISRTWGYITEFFPSIYLKANNKRYYEADVVVEAFSPESKNKIVGSSFENKVYEYEDEKRLKTMELLKSL